jgi:hypothetical protein
VTTGDAGSATGAFKGFSGLKPTATMYVWTKPWASILSACTETLLSFRDPPLRSGAGAGAPSAPFSFGMCRAFIGKVSTRPWLMACAAQET